MTVVARGQIGRDLAAALVAEARRIDPRLVPIRSGRLINLAWRSIEQRLLIRFVTLVVGCGSILMVLIGVWGLAQSNLRRRWREFGIRQALGAHRRDIERLAMRDATIVSAAGGAIGIAAGWQMGAVLKIWIYGVSAHNPLAIGSGAAVVMLAAIAGSIAPARAAGRISASQLLRED
jgi:ABC-type antimicrobial peptide transport system permease subunit